MRRCAVSSHVRGLRCTVALVVMGIGCSDGAYPTRAGVTGEKARVTAAPNPPNGVALEQLTRAIAVAFADAGLRVATGAKMRSDGITRELKLELATFLHSPQGARLRSATAAAAGIDSDSLLRLVDRLPSLEFYMPVRSHRQRWKGADVWVASQLAKGMPLVGFDALGNRISLSEAQAPAIPTFVLVSSETNFAPSGPAALPVSRSSTSMRAGDRQRLAPTGAARLDVSDSCDGTEIILCDNEPSSGGAGDDGWVPPNAPTGLYMTHSNLYDASEPWYRGDPEIEVHILGPLPTDPKTMLRPLHCSGATEPAPYYFDQNANVWNGSVMLLSEAQLNDYGFTPANSEDRRFTVVLYEDDDQACVIHDDPNRLGNDLLNIGESAGTMVALMVRCQAGGCFFANLALYGSIIINRAIDLFTTNDDYLGTATAMSSDPNSANPNTSLTLYKNGNVVNGGIRLVYHVYGQ